MALKKFTTPSQKERRKKRFWTISAKAVKSSQFYVSVYVVEDLGLTPGMRAMLAQDDETLDWFISFGNDPDGSKLSTPTKMRPGMFFSNSRAAVALVESVNARLSTTLLICRRPTIIDGEKWYKLQTAHPMRKN